MRFAIQVKGGYEAVLATARWAEARGLDAIALPDHYLYGPAASPESAAVDSYVQLGGLARETHGIELVTLVSPITFRHPAVYGKMAVGLDLQSGGRFTLGLGTGWHDEEHERFGFEYPPMAERFDRLEEAFGYIRAMMLPEPVGFEGRFYRLDAFDVQPHPVNLRLAIGGGGMRRTPTLAGRFCDEFNAYAGPAMAERVARCRDAAIEAGRDPDAILISAAGPVLVGRDEVDFRAKLEEEAAARGADPEALLARLEERRIPHGDPERVRATLAEIEAAGVERFYVQTSPDTDLDALFALIA